MRKVERRAFLKSVTAGLACAPAILKASMPKTSDIRIEDVSIEYQDYDYRVPIKFGGIVGSKATILNVTCTVSSKGGKTAKGFGSMPVANIWSFPSRVLSYDTTLGAMKTLAGRISTLTGSFKEYGHPIELNWALEPQYLQAAAEIIAGVKAGRTHSQALHAGNRQCL